MKRHHFLAILLSIIVLIVVLCISASAESSSPAMISREGVVNVLDLENDIYGEIAFDGISANNTSLIGYEILDNRAYKFTINDTDFSCSHSSRVDFCFDRSVILGLADYAVLSFKLSTDTLFYSSGESRVALSLFGKGGELPLYLTMVDGEWLIHSGEVFSSDSTVYANLGASPIGEYSFKIILELGKAEARGEDRLHLYLDNSLCYSRIVELDRMTTFDGVRVSFIGPDSLDTLDFTLSHLGFEAVSGSNSYCEYDLAYLLKSGAPKSYDGIADREKILYTIVDADGKASAHSEVVPTSEGGYAYDDAFRSAINGKSSLAVSLKRDVIYDNECTSTQSGRAVFTLASASYSKTIYLNGVTLSHTPYYTNASGVRANARGQMFSFASSSSVRSLNLIGGINATGERSVLMRKASGQGMFSSTAGASHSATEIFFSDIKFVTIDAADAAQLCDGNVDGAKWSFENCEINLALSTTKFTGRTNLRDSLNFINCKINFTKSISASYTDFVFDGCDIYLSADGISVSNSSKIKVNSGRIFGDYQLAVGNSASLELGRNVKLSGSSVIGSCPYVYEVGCYVSLNGDSDARDYPYMTKSLALMANLTLYSNITYNLYIPLGDLLSINEVDADKLDTVTMSDGRLWCVYKLDFPASRASENMSLSITPRAVDGFSQPVLCKTVSVTEYIAKVFANEDNIEEYSRAYRLMSSIVDYVISSAEYFDEDISSEFSLLSRDENYIVSSLTDIPKSNTDNLALSNGNYIKKFRLDVGASEVKFVFTVGKAKDVVVSYQSSDGKLYEKVFLDCNEGDELSVSLRAYDLTSTLYISVDNQSAVGTYDLMAYMEQIKTSYPSAYSLLVKMYGYSISAREYKFGKKN